MNTGTDALDDPAPNLVGRAEKAKRVLGGLSKLLGVDDGRWVVSVLAAFDEHGATIQTVGHWRPITHMSMHAECACDNKQVELLERTVALLKPAFDERQAQFRELQAQLRDHYARIIGAEAVRLLSACQHALCRSTLDHGLFTYRWSSLAGARSPTLRVTHPFASELHSDTIRC